MSDLIVKDAGEIKDGLYNIKDGKLFKYKANGGTVRTYTLLKPKEPIVRCKDCRHMELKDFVYGTCKYRIGTVKPDGFCERGERK